MSRARRPVILVGGVPGNSAEEVFRVVAPIVGDLAIGLTDGEFGLRRFWVFFVAINTWDKHPDVELIRPNPEPIPGFPEWLPPDYHACPWWGPKPGVQKLRQIETLGYPDEALASYKVFCRLRDQGVIPQGARFQQSLRSRRSLAAPHRFGPGALSYYRNRAIPALKPRIQSNRVS